VNFAMRESLLRVRKILSGNTGGPCGISVAGLDKPRNLFPKRAGNLKPENVTGYRMRNVLKNIRRHTTILNAALMQKARPRAPLRSATKLPSATAHNVKRHRRGEAIITAPPVTFRNQSALHSPALQRRRHARVDV
jgi:hypothetical protein